LAIIMITAYGSIDLAVRALKEGATDFILKPWYNDKLIDHLREALSSTKPDPKKGIRNQNSGEGEIIGRSEAMQQLHLKVQKIAPTDANVLILGENGTGKDLIARAI